MRKAIALAHHPWSMTIRSFTPNQHGHNMLQLQLSIICPLIFQVIGPSPRRTEFQPGLAKATLEKWSSTACSLSIVDRLTSRDEPRRGQRQFEPVGSIAV